MTGRTLVLGLGNVLLRDEGIGVWVTDALRRGYEFAENVTVLDGGTLGLDLLPHLDGVARLLLVDAVTLGRAPGEIARLEGSEVPAVLEVKLSPHQMGVQDLLAAARLTGREPPHIVLWGMEPGCLEPGTDFSPEVQEALPRLQAEVLDELRRWGVPASPREGREPPAIWWETPAAQSRFPPPAGASRRPQRHLANRRSAMSKRVAPRPKNSTKSPPRKKQPSSRRSSTIKDLPLSTDRPAADSVKGGIKDSHDRYSTG